MHLEALPAPPGAEVIRHRRILSFEWRRERRVRRVHAFDRARGMGAAAAALPARPGAEVIRHRRISSFEWHRERRIRRIHSIDRARGFEAVVAARNKPVSMKPVMTAMCREVTTVMCRYSEASATTKSLEPNEQLRIVE